MAWVEPSANAVGGAAPREDAQGFESRYDAYRRRQVLRLLHMLPDGGARALYRRARAQPPLSALLAEEDDPLKVLIRYCEDLIPLPPFEVWREDLLSHPDAHLSDLAESLDQPTEDRPSTVETRTFDAAGRSWVAHLRSFRDSGLWRGYITFQEEGSGRTLRTTEVFCEQDVSELRERFQAFESAALEAFLRSALP